MSQENINSGDIIINGSEDNCNEIAQCTARCDSRVLDSITLSECDNKCIIPMGCKGPLIAKIPVVLSDVEVQIDVESEIRLEESALDIKNIDKHIFLTQSKLIPCTNKLFIAGYVQKNIQFSTVECKNETSVSGNIQHTTVNVPFKCVTKIKFFREPIYGKDYKERLNVLDKNMLGKNDKEDSWIHFSKLYEPVYCELEYAKIMETDILNEQCSYGDKLSQGKVFRKFVDKMVIFIRLKVLQNQQVFIPEPNGDVIMVDNCDTVDESIQNKDDNSTYIEMGIDPEKGIIGKHISIKNVDID